MVLSLFNPADMCLPALAEFHLWAPPRWTPYLGYFAATVALEAAVYLIVLRRLRWSTAVAGAFVANFASWYGIAYYEVLRFSYWAQHIST